MLKYCKMSSWLIIAHTNNADIITMKNKKHKQYGYEEKALEGKNSLGAYYQSSRKHIH